jgi:hypothetical protein
MLKELEDIRQIEGEPKRRWFADLYFDLIVWFSEDNEIQGFQLCYDKDNNERALTWRRSSVYTHHRVDDGEGNPGRYKATPILIADGIFDYRVIADRFLKESNEIDSAISKFVYEKLIQYKNIGGGLTSRSS